MTDIMAFATNFAFAGLLAGLALAFIRLCKGPSLADRVIALDLIAFITIGFIGVFTIYSNATAFMDIAITLALVAFLSTIAFARFIMRVPLSQSDADSGSNSGSKPGEELTDLRQSRRLI